ncbi:diguanylate cyclase domain-containing protein [Shewanella algae]|uniref:diguanylate cyclase domain-containing protein n=1 Tax=Shewanella algae TaxID=38313 RepID=UPI001F33BE7D|nr:transporter substrate-binding domain-containing protein [Shewanella algae]MCE9778114.1 transporter substrate-binding domain-containing protein [Shewanella algae]MCE9826518.1 transporter substrate-binding domain-containing protein [Shewanella algae]
MKSLTSLLSLLCVLVCLPLDAATQVQSPAKPLVIVMGEDSYPYQFVDDAGQAQGILVDLWQEWSRVNQRPITLVARHWNDSLKQLKEGKADVHLALALTPEREAEFEFAKPISRIDTYLYLHSELRHKDSFEKLLPYRIGIVKGSSHESDLKAQESGLSFALYPGRDALLKAVSRGEIKVFAGMEGYLRDRQLARSIAQQYPTANRMLIKHSPVAPAVAKGRQALVAEIDSGFAQITPEFIVQTQRRWLGYRADQHGITVAMPLNMEPFSDLGPDGLPHGLYVDIWHKWSAKTGVPVEFVAGSMNSTLEQVKQGIVDAHIGYPESDDLSSGLKRAWHLHTQSSRLFLKGQMESPLALLDGKRLGIFPSSPYITELKQALPKVQLKYFDSLDAMVNAADRGDISGFVSPSAWTQHYLLTHGLWAGYQQAKALQFSSDIYVLTRRQDDGLTQRLIAGFNLLTRDELAALENKWMLNSDDHVYSRDQSRLPLTQAELGYLESLPELKVGYLKDWPPFEFKDEQGQFAGINADVMTRVAQQLGLKLLPVAFDEWRDLLKALGSGEVVMAASLAARDEQHAALAFSDGYWPSPWAMVSTVDHLNLYSLGQLNGQRVAIVEGYQLAGELMAKSQGISPVLVPGMREGLEAVNLGRADLFIDKVVSLASALSTGQYPALKMNLITDMADQKSHIGVTPGYKPLVPLINRVISGIDDSQRQRIHEKWVGTVITDKSQQYKEWLGYFLLALLIALFIVLLVLQLNRRLSREMSLRREAELKMKHLANHDPLTGLPNRALLDDRLEQAFLQHAREQERFAVLFLDVDGFKAINDTYGHEVGDRMLVQVTQRLAAVIRKSDTLVRFGGDEFVVILNRIQDFDAVCQVADNLIQSLAGPLKWQNISVQLSLSVGISVYPVDGDNAIELLKRADQLMYRAKESGGSCYRSA